MLTLLGQIPTLAAPTAAMAAAPIAGLTEDNACLESFAGAETGRLVAAADKGVSEGKADVASGFF